MKWKFLYLRKQIDHARRNIEPYVSSLVYSNGQLIILPVAVISHVESLDVDYLREFVRNFYDYLITLRPKVDLRAWKRNRRSNDYNLTHICTDHFV